MNQMLQDAPELKDAPKVNESSEAKRPPETIGRPPVPAHPRFAKPQRVAFVQSSWHREVVEECRVTFLDEIEARHIARAERSVRGAGFVRNPAACAAARQDQALHRDRRGGTRGRWRHLPP